jgi:hypothetical protein
LLEAAHSDGDARTINLAAQLERAVKAAETLAARRRGGLPLARLADLIGEVLA